MSACVVITRHCDSSLRRVLAVVSLYAGSVLAMPAGLTTHERTQRLAAQLRQELAGSSFHVFVESPFVVIGDEAEERVQRRAAGTIRWARLQLRRDFFPLDPPDPIQVWLLRDAVSYRSVSKRRFGVSPSTPFGYFSSPHKALVVNIATGAGTLVHEIVHPYMAVNLPNCPAWLNEGLASLYEECGDRQGRIWGYPNWRLPRLQTAICDQRLPSLETLCHSSAAEFYADQSGLSYAQARYLCLYLQEHGKLREFFRVSRRR